MVSLPPPAFYTRRPSFTLEGRAGLTPGACHRHCVSVSVFAFRINSKSNEPECPVQFLLLKICWHFCSIMKICFVAPMNCWK